MATELAKAYVQIIPSAQGIQGSISSALSGESTSAGAKAGEGIAGALGKKLKGTLVGLGIGKMVMDAIGEASGFESSMAKVSTLFTGKPEQFAGLQSDILNMSSAYGLGAKTLAEAAYSAESAGVPMEQLTEMLSSSAQLAVAGFTDIDTALSATAKTMNAYGDAAGSIEDIQKILIQTQNLGITTVGELGASLANVTPTAAAMGVGFDQVGAALAQMTASGVPTAQATTQLRSAMTELGKAGTKADKSFREAAKDTQYAGMSFQEAMASGANLGDVFGLMQSYADASGLSMVDLWGSVEAGNAAMTIAGDVEKFNSNLKQMSTEADVVGKAYGKMANTFGTSMNRLKESAKNFMTALFTGGDVSASFDNLLGSLGDVGENLIQWLTNGLKTLGENLPGMVDSLLNFGESILGALGKVDWIKLGTTILNGIIGAIGSLGSRLIELVGSAISGIVGGKIDFGSIGRAIWSGVTSVITTGGTWLSKLFGSAKDAVLGIDFSGIGSTILGGVTKFIDSAGEFLSTIFTAGKDAVTDGEKINWGEVGQSVLNGVTSAIDMAGKFLEGAFKAGKKLVEAIDWNNIGTVIGNGVNSAVDLAGKFLEGCFTAGKSLVEAIDWNNIGTVIGNGVNSAVDLAGKFLEGCFTAGKSLVEAIDWNNIGTVIGNGVNSAVDLAGKFLEGCFTAGKALVEKINWNNLGTVIGNGVNSAVDLAGKFLEGCFTAGKSLVEAIKWNEIGSTIGKAVNSTIDTAGKFLETCFSAGLTLIKTIKWDEIGTSISKGVTGTIDAAGEFLATPFTAAKELITAINWGEVGSAIQGGLGDVWSGLTGFLGGVLGGAGEAASGVGSMIGTGADALGKAFAKLINGDEAKQAASDLKQAMADLEKAITDGKSNIEAAAKEVSKTIKDGIQSEVKANAMEKIGMDAGKNLVNGIKGGIALQESALGTKAASVCNLVKNAFQKDWNAVGVNIVNGIISGITSAAGALAQAMRNMAQIALGSVAGALGIASPSSVMRDQIGKWIPAGIAEGIAQNESMVRDAMAQMSSDLAASDLSGVAIRQGESLGEISRRDQRGGNDGDILQDAIIGLRNDLRNIQLMIGEKVFGRAVVDYGGNRMRNYIGQSEDRLASGFGT